MTYEIRSLSLGEMLDTAFRIVRDHFVLVVGIAAIAYLPLLVALEGLTQADMHTGFRLTSAGLILAAVLAFPVMQAALSTAIADVYLSRPVTIGTAYARGFKLYLPFVGTYLLTSLLSGLAFLALIIPGIYLVVAWMLMNPIMVIEGRFGLGALSRSRELMRGHWWRGFGILFLMFVLSTLVGSLFGTAVSFVPYVGPMLQAVVSSVALTYTSIVLLLLYFDMRCRHEDFDLVHLAQQVAGASTAGSSAPQAVS